MAQPDRCPVCGVAVKPENVIRHLDANHPRHPEMAALKAKLKQESGRILRPARAPLRLRSWYGAAAVAVALAVVGIVAAPVLFPSQGSTFSVDGCISDTTTVYHIHPLLKIVVNGGPYTVLDGIGIGATCMHPIHTHQAYSSSTYPDFAVIHVESPVVQSYTLGQFFHVWGQPFSSSQVLSYVADANHAITMTVGGTPSTAFGDLAFQDGQLIVVTYGP